MRSNNRAALSSEFLVVDFDMVNSEYWKIRLRTFWEDEKN